MNVDSVSAVADLINNMLAKDASERPSARDLSIHFTKSRALSVGYVCHVMEDYKAAIKAYGWVTEVYKEDGSAWRRLGDSYRAANMDNEAIKAYRSAIAAGFTDSSIYIDMENLHAPSVDFIVQSPLIRLRCRMIQVLDVMESHKRISSIKWQF